MMLKRLFATACALSALVSGAAVRTATPFADGMVLQRGRAVPVWGTAAPGEEVRVSFAGQEKSAKAGADGAWCVSLDAMEASKENRTMRIMGGRASSQAATGGRASPRAATIEIKNVLVGEVWFASGQSNMECPIWGANPRYRDGNGLMMVSAARHGDIRYAKNPKRWSAAPKHDQKAVWRDFSPESFAATAGQNLSAVAFYYALTLHHALDVPIGVIDSSYGGSGIDPWMPRSAYAGRAELREVAEYPVTDDWKASMKKGIVDHAAQQPTVLWNGMVAAWAPFAVRGVIWYQGEHNRNEPELYCAKMHALYDGWAAEFRNPNLRFYFAQLAPHKIGWHGLQLAQSQFAAEEKNAAMAVTCDAGNWHDVHPNGKEIVASRLALHALKRDYGFGGIIDDSPAPAKWRVDGNKVVLSFSDAKTLYYYNADISAPKGFEIAGEDGKYRAAKILNRLPSKWNRRGYIDGAELVLAADGVDAPRKVRYLASPPYVGSLYSSDSGLPLGPFEVELSDHMERVQMNSSVSL